MSRAELWIIEARDAEGRLALRGPQPYTIFGMGAIQGMTTDQMAKVIFRLKPEAELHGASITEWPRHIEDTWTARRKTW